ncbi:hypothetical protein ACFZDG_34015 [Kitasatospora xanthocidica]|uniref:hypothetical protein n=1 Tax=Kitasatospora xanthocidica TaxID=83382 RepID=UPI0036EB4A69
MTTPPSDSTALELQRLRGAVSTGFAELKGALSLLVQRAGQTDQQLRDHSAQMAEHDQRLDALERDGAAAEEVRRSDHRRVQTISALAGVAAAASAVVPLVSR